MSDGTCCMVCLCSAGFMSVGSCNKFSHAAGVSKQDHECFLTVTTFLRSGEHNDHSARSDGDQPHRRRLAKRRQLLRTRTGYPVQEEN